jgi:hypothetical protein
LKVDSKVDEQIQLEEEVKSVELKVMDRKQAGRVPRHCEDVLDYPTKNLVLLKDGSMEWIHRATLTAPHEQSAVRRFEHRLERSAARPCNPVRDYSPRWVEDDGSDVGSVFRFGA